MLNATILETTRLITTNQFTAERCLRMIEEYQVNYLMSPPYQLAKMLKNDSIHTTDLSSIRMVGCGGNALANDLRIQIQKFLPRGFVAVAYGLTEMAGVVTANIPPKTGAVGLLNRNLHVKIIDNDGNKCGVNESGEICIKYPYKFLGYYNDEEMTSNAFDADGWFMTGDIGQFDEDGYLFYVDRKKDILKYCNYPIPPSEIEGLLMEHPSIEQVCVVGIPDPICTDLPAAVIVAKNNLTVEEVHKFTEGQCHEYINK